MCWPRGALLIILEAVEECFTGNNPPDQWDHFEPQVHDNPWHYQCPVAGQTGIKPGLHWPPGFPLNGIEAVARGRRPPVNYREFDWGRWTARIWRWATVR